MNKKIIIAIDGFSSSGKSTIGKLLAKKYKYTYIDTGAMYRAVALYAKENLLIGKNYLKEEELVSSLNEIFLSYQFNKKLGYSEIYLNGKNVESKIRTLEISQLVTRVSRISEVRQKLVSEQQQMGKLRGVVMDGRDIGTVVFSDAELKIFMQASVEIRARRRYNELINKGEAVSFDEILFNVQERDKLDSSREDSPLLKAKDAVVFDNSDMNIKDQYKKACVLVEKILSQKTK